MEDKDFFEVEIDRIRESPYQPRRDFSDEGLKGLADSICAVGVIQPLLVRRVVGGGYELIAGERRLRACRLAGLKSIPVFVRESTSQDRAQAALIENIQRVDLNPMEIAMALQLLVEEFDFHQEELACRVGKKRSTVANYLRLLNLPPIIQDSVRGGEVSMGHAKVILSLGELSDQLVLYRRIIAEGLTVREAGLLAAKIGGGGRKSRQKGEVGNPYLDQVARDLERILGTRVTIQPGDKRGCCGKIMIEYYQLEDLDHLLEVLGCQSDYCVKG